jgi:hypothetical protein
VGEYSSERLRGAEPGTRVRTPPSGPPSILVARSLEHVTVSRWPGRLLRVEVVPPVAGEERTARERATVTRDAGAAFTRALAVDVVEELAPSVLFGPHGAAVVRVIGAATALDEDTARRLAAARHRDAFHAYGTAWERWLADQPNGAPYLGYGPREVIAVPGAGPSPSPIGYGFTVVYTAVRDSARLRGGPRAFTVIEDDDEGDDDDEGGDDVLREPWSTALGALLDAAMAFGAPHLVDASATAVLAGAWTAVYGPPDPRRAPSG